MITVSRTVPSASSRRQSELLLEPRRTTNSTQVPKWLSASPSEADRIALAPASPTSRSIGPTGVAEPPPSTDHPAGSCCSSREEYVARSLASPDRGSRIAGSSARASTHRSCAASAAKDPHAAQPDED